MPTGIFHKNNRTHVSKYASIATAIMFVFLFLEMFVLASKFGKVQNIYTFHKAMDFSAANNSEIIHSTSNSFPINIIVEIMKDKKYMCPPLTAHFDIIEYGN